jgi:hypothetical protein
MIQVAIVFIYLLTLVAAANLIYSKLEDITSIGRLHYITMVCTIVGVFVLAPVIFCYMVCNSFYQMYIKE